MNQSMMEIPPQNTGLRIQVFGESLDPDPIFREYFFSGSGFSLITQGQIR